MKTKTQHTPGPWESFCYGPEGTKIRAGDVAVATLAGHARGDGEAARALVADGHLIAAAPELLTALRELVGASEAYASSEPDMPSHRATCHDLDAALEQARAAIAKAEGSR
jgi:hypothetical protein